MPNRVLFNRARQAEARVAVLERDLNLMANQTQADITALQAIISSQNAVITFLLSAPPAKPDVPFVEEVN